MKYFAVALAVATAGLSSTTSAIAKDAVASAAARSNSLPRGFVRLKDLAPGIIQDMRYRTAANFTGRRVPGYLANSCILARPIAKALARVQAAVSADGFSLKVYDCYRPARSVRAFVRWAEGNAGGSNTKFYYPRIRRRQIIPLGYVSKRSSHSLGTAIDLTLVAKPHTSDASAKNSAAIERNGSCISRKSERPADTSIDMGTSWDCFDIRSHTAHREISRAAAVNRRRLKRAMQAEGFRNYPKEWWHYSMRLRNFQRAHNFPVD